MDQGWRAFSADAAGQVRCRQRRADSRFPRRNVGDLRAFARHPESIHRAAQWRLWQHYADAGGAVGVWHEMLPLSDGSYHSLYGNMPPTSIGALRPLRQQAWEMETTATAERQRP